MEHAIGKKWLTTNRLMILFVFLGLWTLLSAVPASANDQTPPYLINPIPEPGSTTSNWFLITTGVLDDESGVNPDPDTVFVYIDGSPPRVKPIIEPSYGDQKGIKITVILVDEEPRGQVVVGVQAEDLAPVPNVMFREWSFFVENVTQNPVPVITYPENHRWLDYGTQSGILHYNWISLDQNPYYRVRFTLFDGQSATMDIEPASVPGSAYNYSFAIELNRDIWSAVSTAGEISIDIGALTEPDGQLIGNYGPKSTVTYVMENLPCLIRPYHSAVLDSVIPPVFEWSPLDVMAEEYVVVFVRLDDNGSYSKDIKIYEVPIFIKTIPMDMTLWNQFEQGNWAWTVVARYPDGQFSDFMIHRFLKN
ncbi:hypothetical protein JW823_03400 [bacterium]|nr:hypothetical protein [candidate division CSSED10-310 bacterium]